MNYANIRTLAVRHRYLTLSLLGILLYVSFAGLRDVWYPDEPDIAEVALAMFLSGDWVSPRRMGVVWVDYPPMIYWVGTLSAHLLDGMSAFALRLPNALAAIGIVLMTCFAASRWYDARTGLWSGAALMTSLLFVYEANSYRPDIYFTLFIAAGFLLYAEGAGDNRRVLLRVAGFACLGLAMLSKGVLGLLLPGLVLVLWHGSRREWLRVLELAPLSLVSLALFVPWVAGTAQAMGWDNILYEFYAQNLARFQSGYRGHEQPLHYYLVNFWLDFSPWSWLLPFAIFWTKKSGLIAKRNVQLLLWWFATFFVFLSLAETKRQLYMLPAFPAVALLIGPWLASFAGGESTEGSAPAANERPVRIYALIMGTVIVLLGLLLAGLSASYDWALPRLDLGGPEVDVAAAARIPLAVFGLVAIAGGLFLALGWRIRSASRTLVRVTVTFVAIYIVILGLVMPTFSASKSYKAQGEWIRARIGVQLNTIGMVFPQGDMGIRKRGAFGFETGGAMVDLLETQQDVEDFLSRHPDSLVLIESASIDRIFNGNREDWQSRVVRDLSVGKTRYVVVEKASGN